MEDFKNLSEQFKTRWARWYRRAPDEYKMDVFDNASPVAFIIKYGQNRMVRRGGDATANPAFWEEEYDLRKFKVLQFAFATHYAYVELLSVVEKRVMLTIHQVLQAGPHGGHLPG